MTATPPATSRRPHFRRHDPPPILITDDDVAIIRFVYEGRFRRSTDICKFMRQRPAKKIIERIGVLFHNAYLDRPQAQRDYFRANKRRPPYIYALGNRGAALLAEVDGIEMPRIDWTDKNRTVSRPYIHHRLLISDVLTSFKMAIRERTDVRWIEPGEILRRAPVATQRLPNPWKWKAKVPAPTGGLMETANVPDAVFGLDFVENRVRYYFMLEADRASMPVVRATLSRTSMYGKFLTYFHAHRAGFHMRTYNIQNYRVLTVTTSPERAANMIEVIKKKLRPSNMFLFTDATALRNAGDVLAHGWLSGKGEVVRLTD